MHVRRNALNSNEVKKSRLKFLQEAYEEFAKRTYNHGFIYTATEKLYGRYQIFFE